MWIYFNYIVVHSKYLLEGVHTVITDSRDEGGFIVSLSQVCYKIINHPEQTQGARSDSDRARHSRIFKRRYNVREEGEESGGGVKFVFKVFDKDYNYGLRSYYNVRADPEVLEKNHL